MFKTKMEFTYEPIMDIFTDISRIIYGDDKNIFSSFVENIESFEFEIAWKNAVLDNSIGLTKEDIEIVNKIGIMLGKTDINGQKTEIELANELLSKQIFEAEESRNKNEKLYKTLGLISGITIAIIFV